MVQYTISGMECSACSARLEKVISGLEGVNSCSVNLLSETMVVDGSAEPEMVLEAVRKAGFDGKVKDGGFSQKTEKRDGSEGIKRELVISVLLVLVLMYFSMGGMAGLPQPGSRVLSGLIQAVLAFAVMVLNRRFFISGTKALKTKSPNMDTLVSVGSGVSFVYSCAILFLFGIGKIQKADLYFDSAAMILAFVTIGKLLESRSRLKTTDAVKGLMALIPKNADVIRNGEEIKIPIENLSKGDRVVIKSGSVIPADGCVAKGMGTVDESALTGESIPVEKSEGCKVYAGTVNTSGYFEYEAEKTGDETAVSGIIRLVEETGATKAPIAKAADKVAAVFVPAVFAVALITFAVRYIITRDISFAVNGAVSVIVVSCPCSLGLATPVAITVGSGKGARLGILYKSAAVLEESGRIENVVFDKTGTLTEGKLEVTEFVCSGDEKSALEFLYSLEKCSGHPIAGAAVEYAKARGAEALSVDDVEFTEGLGLSGVCNGRRVQVGNGKLLNDTIEISEDLVTKGDDFSKKGNTVLFLIVDDTAVGVMAVADRIRKESRELIDTLKDMKLNVYLMSGDNRVTAEGVAGQLGIDNVYSEILPDGKANAVREICKTGKTIMVGDGINDAPALVTADVGIAVGNGTDIAIESADVLLTGSDIYNVANVVKLGKAVVRNIHQNLFWAFIYNSIGIPLAAGAFYGIWGIQLNPMICAAAMSLSSICVVSNALRLNRFQPERSALLKKG